jgi:hypothetical protein
MIQSSEDYIIPPSYKVSQETQDSDVNKELNHTDNPLFTKFCSRIQKDLNQINGVYDNRIVDAEENKRNEIKKLVKEYYVVVNKINKQRSREISMYNEKAESHIDGLISTSSALCWWEKLSWNFF